MKKLLIVLVGVLLLLPSSLLAADLKYGMKNNEEVRQLQTFLKEQKMYSGQITGNFYSMTLAAVKKFQKTEGMKVTGVWNEESRNKMQEKLAVADEVYSPAPVAEASSNIPVGWIANGDGTWRAPEIAQPWTPPVQVSYAYQPQTFPYIPPVVTNQTSVTQPTQTTNQTTETKVVQPPVSSSVPTSTPAIAVTSIALGSTFGSAVRPPGGWTGSYYYPPFFPFYYYVNCSSDPTDGNQDVLTMKVDPTLDERTVIPGASLANQIYSNDTGWTIAWFTIYDNKVYDAPFGSQTVDLMPDYWTKYNKAPKIKSVTIKNTTNFDWSSADLKLVYDEPIVENINGKPKVTKNFSLPHPKPIPEISAATLTRDTATFVLPKPIVLNGVIPTEFSFTMNINKMKKLDTLKLQLVNIELENNDQTRNYTIEQPLPGDASLNKTLIKCDRRY